jgi:hypothetical protein
MDWGTVNQGGSTPKAHLRDSRTPPGAESLFEDSADSPLEQWDRQHDGWRAEREAKRRRAARRPAAPRDEPDAFCRPCGPASDEEADASDHSDVEDVLIAAEDDDEALNSDDELAANAAAALDFEQGVRSATSRLGLANTDCDTSGCWGCQYGATMHARDGDNPKIAEIIRLIRDNHGRMEDRELARIVARHHKEYIRKPSLAAGVACARWTKAQILRHIRHHTLDPTIVFAENIRTLRGVVRMLKERATHVDPETGESAVNHRNIDLLIKTIRGMSDLYTKRAHELLFGPSPNQPDYLLNPNKPKV